MNPRERNHPHLPPPEKEAYFLQSGTSEILANEALRRVGDNLVFAIEYGSHVSGDASPTSRYDMLLVVGDTRIFHERNMDLARADYGQPRSVGFHTFLNGFGFNFYQTTLPREEGDMWVKYGVISVDNFVKGCNGTLKEKEREGKGAFGFYVAGRMQKAALRPLCKRTDEKAEDVQRIEEAINIARIDGVWLALGLQEGTFSTDDLLKSYVSLSYRADLRIEKPGKTQTLIDKNRSEYEEMLVPIIEGFVEHGLMRIMEDGSFKKIESLPHREVEKRLRRIKLRTAVVNYVKNPTTMGVGRGIRYALEKVKRARS